jgi:hypothetical protein
MREAEAVMQGEGGRNGVDSVVASTAVLHEADV